MYTINYQCLTAPFSMSTVTRCCGIFCGKNMVNGNRIRSSAAFRRTKYEGGTRCGI